MHPARDGFGEPKKNKHTAGVTKSDILLLALLAFAFGFACLGMLVTGGGSAASIVLGVCSGVMFLARLMYVLIKLSQSKTEHGGERKGVK